jgi:DNA polymerase-3 subunit epsilon
VEIAVVRIEPGGDRSTRTRRVNPGRPIPAGATAIHGIRDVDVQDEPPFARVARSLLEFLDGADLAGFNVRRFDGPLLDREFRECGLDLDLGRRRMLDAMVIFHRKEPRDLSGAVRHYLSREHEGAHGAEADVDATIDVLEAQLERYSDLPRSVEELDAWTGSRPDAVDERGKFVRRQEEIVFAFGKHQGRPLRDVAREAPDYLRWIVGTDFPEDAKQLVQRALDGDL